MASSYTSNSGIEKPAEGDQTGEWGDTVNTNMDIIDRSINGVGAITLSGTTHTLTTTDGTLSDGMYKVLVLGGSPSGTNTITIAPNDADKVYIVVNSSGQTATFTQGSGGNVSVLNGDSKIIYADGAGSGAAIVDVTADLSFSSVNIDGGTIDGTVIGGASAAAGTFTTVTASGEIDGASLDISGNADIDGTLETDALSIASTTVTSTAAELNYNDTGAAVGTVVASKTVTVDANKDVSSFRNITLTGELDAGSLDISGDADIDGTLEADAMTLNGTAITTTATLSTGISNTNVPVFTSGVADDDFLRVAGTSIEGRSAAEVLSDIGGQASLTFGISNTNAVKIDSASVADDEYARFTASGLESRSTSEVLSDIGGQASLTFGISNTNAVKIDSSSVADDEYARFTANGLESRSTAEVLSDIGGQASLTFGISNTNAVKIDSASVADDEYARFTANGLESRSTAEVLSDIGASPAAGSGSIVTTGALDSGSITSGFGTINNGSSAITTTGLISGGSLDIDDVVINGSTIGHTDDTDLITVADGIATVAGEVSMTTLDIGGTNVTSTAAELNLVDGSSAGSVVNSKAVIYSSGGVVNATDVAVSGSGARSITITSSDSIASMEIGSAASNAAFIDLKTPSSDDFDMRISSESGGSGGFLQVASGNLTLTGSGKTSAVFDGDGAVSLYHNNSVKIATTATGADITGAVTAATFEPDGDTAAGDNAAIGYTSAEGLILTGQGSTSDVSIKNDVDATVLSIPTGTTGVNITSAIDVLGSNFANVEFTGASVNGSGVYTGLDSGGGYVVNVRDSGYIGFSTTNAERMRIASDGKVGIGTSSPDGRLHVHTSSAGTVTAATDANQLVLESTANVGMSFLTGNASVARIKFGDPDSNSSGAIVYAHSEDSMRFNTGGSERMRIRSNGQVLINSTSIIASDNAYLQVTGGSVTPVALRGGTNNYFMAFYKQSNNDLIGSITGSSGTATAFNTSSDYRLKENVSYTFDATTRLKQLKPARFNFIADSDNTVDGFLAHEVSSVVPEAITGTHNEVDDEGNPVYQGIDQSKLVPLLVKTIQELEARITALEAG